MKKILAILLAAVSLTVSAKETVTLVYSWSPSDVAANFHRQIAIQANLIQDKYYFVFDVKPGAGGSIAANFVNNTPNTILANSSAFYIRPNFFPEASHTISNYRELLPICSAPIAISSKKYKTWAEVPTDQPITIGTSGLGITTHLVATQIAKKYPQVTVVPFKSTNEALVSVLSGNTDLAVNFMGDSEQYVNSEKNRIYILGITGTHSIKGVGTLATQGFPAVLAEMDSPAQLFVPAKMDDTKFKEWREILVRAGKTPQVQDTFKFDYCKDLTQMPNSEIDTWFNTQITRWKEIASQVTLK